jgi:hypothetical protein
MPLAPGDWLQAITFRFGRRLHVDGFDARAELPDAAERLHLAHLINAALALVSQHSPTRYAYLKRDLPRLWIAPCPAANARCFANIRMCVINYDWAVSPATSADRLALALVHEGTHARLIRAGLKYDDPQTARHERLCYTAELVVARRFATAPDLVPRIQEMLDCGDAEFTPAADRDRQLQELASLGVEGRVGAAIARSIRWLHDRFGAA